MAGGSLADLNYCWSVLKNWPRGSSMGYSDPSAAAPTAFRSARARFNCQLSAKYGAQPKNNPREYLVRFTLPGPPERERENEYEED